jgi:hypothetical protein
MSLVRSSEKPPPFRANIVAPTATTSRSSDAALSHNAFTPLERETRNQQILCIVAAM